jgi:hypothetical protein
MMARARYGAGSIRQRRDNLWEARYQQGGRQHSLYGRTREDAEAKLARRLEEIGASATDRTATLEDWAALARRRERQRAPRGVAVLYQRVALVQLAGVVDDVLALPALPAGLRDDLELTLAAARTALSETREEVQTA